MDCVVHRLYRTLFLHTYWWKKWCGRKKEKLRLFAHSVLTLSFTLQPNFWGARTAVYSISKACRFVEDKANVEPVHSSFQPYVVLYKISKVNLSAQGHLTLWSRIVCASGRAACVRPSGHQHLHKLLTTTKCPLLDKPVNRN